MDAGRPQQTGRKTRMERRTRFTSRKIGHLRCYSLQARNSQHPSLNPPCFNLPRREHVSAFLVPWDFWLGNIFFHSRFVDAILI